MLNTAACESECWHIYTLCAESDWQSLLCSFHREAQKSPSFCIPVPGVAKRDGSACFLCKTWLFKKQAVVFVSEMQLELTEKM